ncbi:hypothetical protein OVY01_09280 [Robbsia sp. Bb-Pol-6]|uniref:Integrase n=1 Tax=Robbsia betulipollinis TaxID=2981849 RepID=A0ABT3ZN92_9BURK|nr:hypothetical protein [Robbsia betulipollinis]MCY0387425.1 hypothetical protein [Robbsia betulipollinis]
MATIRKRNNIWRAEICRLRVRLSGSFHTKAQAVAWATQKEAEIIAGKDLAWTDMTVAETFCR